MDVNDRGSQLPPIGFCPQFDIVYLILTVKEHFIFFSMLKGLSYREAKKDAEQLIKDVDLELDYFKISTQLSGKKLGKFRELELSFLA